MLLLLLVIANSPIVISEVMSNVKGSESTCGDRNEFVEIYNLSADTIDLSTYYIYDYDVIPDEIFPWEDESILINYPGVRINSTHIYPYSYALILDREYTSSDTSGGNVQPYNIPDSTLILTTDDTTIGNGIQNNDPLILYSEIEACTTSFGTPDDSLDNFPYDPGDGISWERINLALPDTITNWHPSIDSSGCTPGRENSVVSVEEASRAVPAIEYISFNSITTGRIKLKINLISPVDVETRIFDLTGRVVETIFNLKLPAGETTLEHNSTLPNGVYFVEVKINKITKIGKVLIVR